MKRRNICFVTGTRAEFGLMRATLEAIRSRPDLRLQLIVTGMHLDRRHGRTLAQLAADGPVDAVVPWRQSDSASGTAIAAGRAIAALAGEYDRLNTDMVLVVGDRVEAFAAAAAGAISQKAVAHVHGGDRAIGQVDDSLRHAITKLSHIHLAATADSARRIARLGEDRWRIHATGAPGIEGIISGAAPAADLRSVIPQLSPGQFALLVHHPVRADPIAEEIAATIILRAVARAGIRQVVAIYPNNDPGAAGIIAAFDQWRAVVGPAEFISLRSVTRPVFLGLLRHAVVLAGNSSSGIIEAASFHCPVVNIGPRQQGRLASENVLSVPVRQDRIVIALRRALRWRRAGRRFHNIYAARRTGERIAAILAQTPLDARLIRKLIAY